MLGKWSYQTTCFWENSRHSQQTNGIVARFCSWKVCCSCAQLYTHLNPNVYWLVYITIDRLRVPRAAPLPTTRLPRRRQTRKRLSSARLRRRRQRPILPRLRPTTCLHLMWPTCAKSTLSCTSLFVIIIIIVLLNVFVVSVVDVLLIYWRLTMSNRNLEHVVLSGNIITIPIQCKKPTHIFTLLFVI